MQAFSYIINNNEKSESIFKKFVDNVKGGGKNGFRA